ncbi:MULTISPECIES: ABC-2 family transporter protein [Streptomyces]|uniref:ABC-2 family transporter protein n=1 Tax=Streptomyces edwardsiae TaxID=3075527 RepID=A0ABU2Q274_9ACTN|nr:ABC-2 family transporter protein [Streptomyces sp. DSM 41636]MDT0398517.1 ABC-2 family transporter protein [Streptomyces sp. DSM 41636]
MTTTSGTAVPARRVGRLRLAAVIVRAGLRSQLANRADFAMAVANGVTYQITVLLFATVIFSRFSSLGGWGLGEILLISSIRMLGHGLYMLFFGNLGLIPHLLREGRFEAFRTRPAPVLLQVFTYEAPINALGDLVVAGASLTVCLSLVDVTWSPAALCFLAVAVAAATVIELGLNLHIAGLVLRFRGSESLFFWLDNTAGNFGNYPLSVFPAVLQGAFTFGIPIAFAGYYPAAWLTGHAGTVPVSPVLVYLSPLVALLALLSGLAVWRRCLAWYSRNG